MICWLSSYTLGWWLSITAAKRSLLLNVSKVSDLVWHRDVLGSWPVLASPQLSYIELQVFLVNDPIPLESMEFHFTCSSWILIFPRVLRSRSLSLLRFPPTLYPVHSFADYEILHPSVSCHTLCHTKANVNSDHHVATVSLSFGLDYFFWGSHCHSGSCFGNSLSLFHLDTIHSLSSFSVQRIHISQIPSLLGTSTTCSLGLSSFISASLSCCAEAFHSKVSHTGRYGGEPWIVAIVLSFPVQSGWLKKCVYTVRLYSICWLLRHSSLFSPLQLNS